MSNEVVLGYVLELANVLGRHAHVPAAERVLPGGAEERWSQLPSLPAGKVNLGAVYGRSPRGEDESTLRREPFTLAGIAATTAGSTAALPRPS